MNVTEAATDDNNNNDDDDEEDDEDGEDDEEKKEDNENDDVRRLKQGDPGERAATGMPANRKLRRGGKGGRLADANIKFQTYDARSPIAPPRWA